MSDTRMHISQSDTCVEVLHVSYCTFSKKSYETEVYLISGTSIKVPCVSYCIFSKCADA